MKIIFTLIFIALSGCSKGDDVSQKIATMMSQTVSANTRVGACTSLADHKETRVINSLVDSLKDNVVKGCATRSLIMINSSESLESLLKFADQSDFDQTIFSMAVRFGNNRFLFNIQSILISKKSHSDITANEIELIDNVIKELIVKQATQAE